MWFTGDCKLYSYILFMITNWIVKHFIVLKNNLKLHNFGEPQPELQINFQKGYSVQIKSHYPTWGHLEDDGSNWEVIWINALILQFLCPVLPISAQLYMLVMPSLLANIYAFGRVIRSWTNLGIEGQPDRIFFSLENKANQYSITSFWSIWKWHICNHNTTKKIYVIDQNWNFFREMLYLISNWQEVGRYKEFA